MTPEQAQRDCHGSYASPLNWEMKNIGDVFKVVERPLKMEGDKPYRRVTVKRRYGGIELRDVRLGEEIKVKSQFLVKAGDFLISERQIVHGACGIVPMSLDGALVSNEYLVLEPRDGFEVSYFNYLVQLLEYAKLFLLCSQGVDVEKFLFKPQDWLKKVVPAPPHAEQKKIAAILTSMDDKLDVIARQIEATQTLKQGLMQTLFSRGVGTQDADGRWVPHVEFKDSELGEIPVGWTLMPLEELAVENITYGVVQPGESVEGGIPLVRGGDIKSGRIAANLRTVSTEISNQFKRTILKGGEVLVSLVGYPGETAVVPSQLAGANIARQAGMIRTGCVTTSEFIHYYLSSPVGKSFLLAGMIGSAQQVINLKALREVLIPLPSVAERERICSICSAVTKKLQALEDKQSSFQDLKRGLMQKLLTGEWRVNVDPSATGT